MVGAERFYAARLGHVHYSYDFGIFLIPDTEWLYRLQRRQGTLNHAISARATPGRYPGRTGGTVADKVGEVDGYYHDAAIVYGSKKTYVLGGYVLWRSFPALPALPARYMQQ
jgi:hypothetical protein